MRGWWSRVAERNPSGLVALWRLLPGNSNDLEFRVFLVQKTLEPAALPKQQRPRRRHVLRRQGVFPDSLSPGSSPLHMRRAIQRWVEARSPPSSGPPDQTGRTTGFKRRGSRRGAPPPGQTCCAGREEPRCGWRPGRKAPLSSPFSLRAVRSGAFLPIVQISPLRLSEAESHSRTLQRLPEAEPVPASWDWAATPCLPGAARPTPQESRPE